MTIWTHVSGDTFTGEVIGHTLRRDLNEIMEFHCPIEVREDMTIDDEVDLALPVPDLVCEVDDEGSALPGDDQRLIEEARRQGWELQVGLTGQYSYNGPVMHESEFVGGGLVRHILERPGYWVVLPLETSDIEDETPAGWLLAHIETSS